jgi:hypothetical protein
MTTLLTNTYRKHDNNQNTKPIRRNIIGQRMLIVGKFKIDIKLYDAVNSLLSGIRPSLIEEQSYSLVELLGKDFVAKLNAVEKRLAEICLDDLVYESGGSVSVSDEGKTYLWSEI